MEKLSKEQTAELSMELISIAGDSIGLNLTAIQKAKKCQFDDAKELMKKANQELTKVHKIHAELIQKEAQGIEPYISTLFVHAQDHFANSLIYDNLTKIIVDLYIKLEEKKLHAT